MILLILSDHVDCRKAGIKAFTDRYKRFCKHYGCEFQEAKAKAIYKDSRELIATLPKDVIYKKLIQESIRQLNLLSENNKKSGNDVAFLLIISASAQRPVRESNPQLALRRRLFYPLN